MAGAAGGRDQAVRAETVCTTEGGRRRKARNGEQLEHVSVPVSTRALWSVGDYIII